MPKPEDILRDKIKTVLDAIKLPGERVIDNCGTIEHGLDLILLKEDCFGKLRAHGVQVKAGNITCSARRATNKIKEIIGQVAIAYGKPIHIEEKSYSLDGLYVVTDGEINPTAREYINSALVGIRNFHFLDKDGLAEFFNRFESVSQRFEET